MDHSTGKRISGTFSERLLFLAMPVGLVFALFLFVMNPVREVPLLYPIATFILISFTVWAIDCEAAGGKDLVDLLDGPILTIGSDLVPPAAVQSITRLYQLRRGNAGLVEIVYRTTTGTKSALIISKPSIFGINSRTIQLLLRSHPKLKSRIKPMRLI